MSAPIDLTGQRFGRLTAMVLSGPSAAYGRRWSCQCDCGNTTVVTAASLRRGNTKSCGCLRHAAKPRARDLSGMRFGKLTAIERAPNRPYGRGVITMWRCVCDCGGESVVSTSKLVSGWTKSCGCFRREAGRHRVHNLVGRRFGRLLVIARIYRPDNARTWWHCKCACGNEVVVVAHALISKNTSACGCLRKDNAGREHMRRRLLKLDQLRRDIHDRDDAT